MEDKKKSLAHSLAHVIDLEKKIRLGWKMKIKMTGPFFGKSDLF